MEVRWKYPGYGAENGGPPEGDPDACAACHDAFFWDSLVWVPVQWDEPPTEAVTACGRSVVRVTSSCTATPTTPCTSTLP